jgi:hypothetical protein
MSGAEYFFMLRSLDDLKKNAKLTKHQEVNKSLELFILHHIYLGRKAFFTYQCSGFVGFLSFWICRIR